VRFFPSCSFPLLCYSAGSPAYPSASPSGETHNTDRPSCVTALTMQATFSCFCKRFGTSLDPMFAFKLTFRCTVSPALTVSSPICPLGLLFSTVRTFDRSVGSQLMKVSLYPSSDIAIMTYDVTVS